MHSKCTCTHTKINLVIALCQASAIWLVNKSMWVTISLNYGANSPNLIGLPPELFCDYNCTHLLAIAMARQWSPAQTETKLHCQKRRLYKVKRVFPPPINFVQRREMAHPVPTKDILQLSLDMVMHLSAWPWWTHPSYFHHRSIVCAKGMKGDISQHYRQMSLIREHNVVLEQKISCQYINPVQWL